MDGSFISRCLVQHAPADVSPNVLAVLLRQLDSARSGVPLPAPPAADDVSALVAQHGYRMAEAVAKVADDPQVLAKLAKHSSVQVRRAVANSDHMDQDTVEYLWRWAWTNDDQDALVSLARCVSFEALLVQTSRLRFVSDSWTHHRSGSCFSLEPRLREGPDRTVKNLRATISCHDIEEALAAVTLCAVGRFDGVSYKEALDLFVEQQSRHDNIAGDPLEVAPPVVPDKYIALCLRYTLSQDSSVTVDEELAGLVVEHTDRLTGLRPFSRFVDSRSHATRPHPIQHYGVGLSPLPVKATPDAARILLGTGNLALTNAFIDLANRSELRRELDADNIFAAFWALWKTSPSLDTVLANQALRLLRQEHHDPPQQALDMPAVVVIDDDLLAWLVHNSPANNTDSLSGFVTGCFVQKPRTSTLGELLNGSGAPDGEPDPNEVSHRARRIMHCFDRWEDKPWADALIEALGPAMWAPTAPYKYVADRLFAEFGDSVELWTGCLGLLESGFPGSLPELLDMAWAIHGDGLTRPDLTTPPCVPEPVEDVSDGDVSASTQPPRPGSFLAALLQ